MTKLQYSKTGQRHAQNAAKTLHIVQRTTGFRANHFLKWISHEMLMIFAIFVLQPLKTNSIQYRNCTTRKKWTGWDLNPRPQQCHWNGSTTKNNSRVYYSYI